jgi:hypothetical protein
MGLEVLTTTKMLIVVFWVVTPCSIVGDYRRFGGKYLLHLQSRVISYVIRPTIRINYAFTKLYLNAGSLQ